MPLANKMSVDRDTCVRSVMLLYLFLPITLAIGRNCFCSECSTCYRYYNQWLSAGMGSFRREKQPAA